ncbi:MAG: hypothetical protein WDO56_10970 [Gammaproteobacteria bacterium]
MRFAQRKKTSVFREREELLRRGRAAAQTLRTAHPSVTSVSVQLRFLSKEVPFHAPQSFALYPPAKMHLAFPCPFGDCSGIYELDEAGLPALKGEKNTVTGKLECSGLRSRDGASGQPCGLWVSYTITAHHEPVSRS